MEQEGALPHSARLTNLEQTEQTQIVNPTNERADEEYRFGAPSEWGPGQATDGNAQRRVSSLQDGG